MPRLSLHSHATFPALFFLAGEAICLPTVRAQHYRQTNLTADHAGIGTITDLNLVNPWGCRAAQVVPGGSLTTAPAHFAGRQFRVRIVAPHQ